MRCYFNAWAQYGLTLSDAVFFDDTADLRVDQYPGVRPFFRTDRGGRTKAADDGRHIGIVVDDKEAVRRALAEAGIEPLPGRFLDFRDPWGNRIEIVGYDNIQFSKAPNVLRGMGLAHLTKTEKAIQGLTDKGMAPN